MRLRSLVMMTAALGLLACPGSSTSSDAGTDAGRNPAADSDSGTLDPDAGSQLTIAIPGTAPYDAFTWIPVTGTACASGTATGLAVNPHQGSGTLTVYFEGGGACWNTAMCLGGYAANLTGYGAANIVSDHVALAQNFSRTDPANPFKDDNFVFIPYCTGDIHAGNNVKAYPLPDGGTLTAHHVGYVNAQKDLEVIRATFGAPSRIVVTGSSAGGYGAAFNYAQIHAAYPNVPMYLIDDAGPVLAGNRAWYAALEDAWHEEENFPADCTECRSTYPDGGAQENGGPYQVLPHYTKQAGFRGSLLVSQRDDVISGFYMAPPGTQNNSGCDGSGPCDFQTQLFSLYDNALAPANAAGPGELHVFLPQATFHTFLPGSFGFTQGDVSLKAFLTAQVTDGGAYTDYIPGVPLP